MIRKLTPTFIGLIALTALMLYLAAVLLSRKAACEELHQVNDCRLIYTPVRSQ